MSNGIANEQELQAALAEVSANAATIPDLSDGSHPESEVVPVIVPVNQPDLGSSPPADEVSTQPVAVVEQPAPRPATTTDGKQLLDRFKKAKQTADPAEAAAAAAVIAPRSVKLPSAPPLEKPKKVVRPSRLVPMIDATFRAIDRPFFWVPVRVRGVLGPLALATLIMSGLAGTLLPLLIPRKDVTDFIRERRALAERPVAMTSEVAAHGEAAEKTGDHGKAEKTEAHGEKKSDGHGGEKKDAKSGAHDAKKPAGDEKKKDDAHGASKATEDKKEAAGHGSKEQKPQKESGGDHAAAKSDGDAKKKTKADHGAEKKTGKGGPH